MAVRRRLQLCVCEKLFYECQFSNHFIEFIVNRPAAFREISFSLSFFLNKRSIAGIYHRPHLT